MLNNESDEQKCRYHRYNSCSVRTRDASTEISRRLGNGNYFHNLVTIRNYKLQLQIVIITIICASIDCELPAVGTHRVCRRMHLTGRSY